VMSGARRRVGEWGSDRIGLDDDRKSRSDRHLMMFVPCEGTRKDRETTPTTTGQTDEKGCAERTHWRVLD